MLARLTPTIYEVFVMFSLTPYEKSLKIPKIILNAFKGECNVKEN